MKPSCPQELQQFYLISVLAIFVFAMVLQIPRLNVNGNVKLIVFVAWAAYGVLPTLHWSVAMGGMDNPMVHLLLPRVLGMYLISGCAFLIYITRIPERFAPGGFSSLFMWSQKRGSSLVGMVRTYIFEISGDTLMLKMKRCDVTTFLYATVPSKLVQISDVEGVRLFHPYGSTLYHTAIHSTPMNEESYTQMTPYINTISSKWFQFLGWVDFVGSSHQWWHALVVLALYYWHNTGMLYVEYRMNHGCPRNMRL